MTRAGRCCSRTCPRPTPCGCATATPSRARPRASASRRRPTPIPVAGDGGSRARAVLGAVPPRGVAHAARAGRDEAVPLRRVRSAARLDADEHRRRAGRGGSASRSGDAEVLCALSRRRRLRRRGAARAPGGRRPADLRLRRPRAQPRGGARAGRGDLRAALPRAARAREGRGPVPGEARRGDRPRGQAQGDRRGVHPRVRGGRARAHAARGSSCRARCIPT